MMMTQVENLWSVAEESAFFYPSEQPSACSTNMRPYFPELRNHVCLPESCLKLAPQQKKSQIVTGLKDDNRCLILPQYSTMIARRKYYLDAKGIGARTPMYGFSMPGQGAYHWGSRFSGQGIDEHWKTMTQGSPQYTGEMWFGNGPYGAHGTRESLDSIAVTELCTGEIPNNLNGFWICPAICSTELPEWVVSERKKYYWYRKYPGKWSQQLRLIPGNIRLYFHSDCTLGIAPQKVFSLYHVEQKDDADRFIEAYISSGVAALTLAARTARRNDSSIEVLDYDDVWLDKDSIIAPDGTLHFADIDDLEWRIYQDQVGVKKKIRREFERNFFEFMFGLDSIVSEAYLLEGRSYSPEERREDIGARFELALMLDNYTKTERHTNSLDIIVNAPGVLDEPEQIRLLDFEK